MKALNKETAPKAQRPDTQKAEVIIKNNNRIFNIHRFFRIASQK